MVFTFEDRVCVTDQPPKQSYQNVRGQAAVVIDQENWSYAMPRHEARLMADKP
jgi:hypothetical protein